MRNQGPNPEQTSKRPLLPKITQILPKHDKNNQSHAIAVHQPLSTQARCPLLQCRRTECKLRSHWQLQSQNNQYGQRESLAQRSSTALVTYSINGQAYWIGEAADALTLSRDSMHALPSLPLDGAEDPSMRRLFHQFYQDTYYRLHLMVSPPPITDQWKAAMLEDGLTDSVNCLNALIIAHNWHMRNCAERHENPSSRYFYGKTTQLLLRKLGEPDKLDPDKVILIVVALITLEVYTGHLKYLDYHRQGLHDLVSRQGGIYKLRGALHWTLHIDRILAVYTSTPARYGPPLDQSIRRPRANLVTHGYFFGSWQGQGTLAHDVVEHCLDMCEVLEEFETQQITYDPAIARTVASPKARYFYFIRDRAGNQFTILNAQYSKQINKSRCILLASRIHGYPILYDNWIPDMPPFLATKLQEALSARDIEREWAGYENLLIWVLFVLAVMPNSWRGRQWVLDLLSVRLGTKYDGLGWPRDWRDIERASLNDYIWNATAYDRAFLAVCNTLTSSMNVTWQSGLRELRPSNDL